MAILKIKVKFDIVAFKIKSDHYKGGNQEKKQRIDMKYEAKKKKGAIEKVKYSYRNIGKMDSLVALQYNSIIMFPPQHYTV